MAFSKADKIAIKFLRQNKQYGTEKFIKEFPGKGWWLGKLKKLTREIDTSGTAAQRPGSGHRWTVAVINDVEALVLSQDDNPQTHRTQRQIAHELGISQQSVNNIVKRDLCLKCLK